MVDSKKQLFHAFLITAHRDFEQLSDILRILKAPNHIFIINIDKKVANHRNIADNIVHEFPNTKILHEEITHGGYSQIDVTLKMLRIAYQNNADYFHLCSGQDFPCKTNDEFDRFFENHNGESFMKFDSEEQHDVWKEYKYPRRVNCFYFNDVKSQKHGIIRKTVLALNFISTRLLGQIRKNNLDLRAGWNWFSWHRKVTEYVLEQYDANPKYFNRFHNTSCCDEVIFHTLLFPKLDALSINRDNSLRYVNWTKKVEGRSLPNRPLILNEEEFDEINKADIFFCRKIDPVISSNLITILKDRCQRNNFQGGGIPEKHDNH